MDSWRSDLVLPDGSFDAARVSFRETIYEGPEGRTVERFRIGLDSYIYKPCQAETADREKWAYEHIIPSISGIRVPRQLAFGVSDNPRRHWLIYEDLGQLRHCADIGDLMKAAGRIPRWHRLSPERVPAACTGHTPYYSDVVSEIAGQAESLYACLEGAGINSHAIASWLDRLPGWGRRLPAERVVSHGDYYPLNIAFIQEDIVVLDWEFVHLNSIYWDLYSLMDLTHHRYAQIPLHNTLREKVLHQYWSESEHDGRRSLFHEFVQGYYVYASVFSARIAGLIEQDLRGSAVSREALLEQKEVTLRIFADCLRGLGLANGTNAG